MEARGGQQGREPTFSVQVPPVPTGMLLLLVCCMFYQVSMMMMMMMMML
jgi:hypothetical protein